MTNKYLNSSAKPVRLASIKPGILTFTFGIFGQYKIMTNKYLNSSAKPVRLGRVAGGRTQSLKTAVRVLTFSSPLEGDSSLTKRSF